MQVDIKKLPKSEIEITGEISAEEFDKFWQKAVKELALEVKIPGFRPGNIPEKILLERLGDGAVLDRAADLAIRQIYPGIVEEHKLDIIGHPHAHITKIAKSSPLGFKIITAVLPEIKLPENFKEIAAKAMRKKEEVVIEEKEINETLEQLRKMRAKDKDNLPELNDEFAKSIGKFNGLIDLKKALSENLKYEKEMKQKEQKRLEALEGIIGQTTMEIPDVLVEGEKFKMLQDLKASVAQMGLKWEDYLAHLKKENAEQEIIDGFKEPALKRAKYGLILQCLGNELKIEISDSEIEDKIRGFALSEEKIDREHLKDYAYGIIKNEKIFKILEN